MKSIFLESHNIKNRKFGLGQFNYGLIQALAAIEHPEIRITLHAPDVAALQAEFGNAFTYKKYYELRRHAIFRVRTKYDLWHSLNQNIKVEPAHHLPYLLTVHDTGHLKESENYKQEKEYVRLQKKLNRSTAITYISEFAKSSTHQFFEVPSVPEFVIHNGNTMTDTSIPEDFKPAIVVEHPYLFAIGQISERKNFGSLVRMLKHTQNYHLVIAGKNTTATAAKVRALIKGLGLENRVHLVGAISELEKKYYYAHCEAFVFPSLSEGFGLPVIEAMTFGKPVFTSNNTSLPEVGGDAAYYWDHYDPMYMSDILKSGLKDFNKSKVSKTNQIIARSEEFNWNVAARQYFEVYKTLLNV